MMRTHLFGLLALLSTSVVWACSTSTGNSTPDDDNGPDGSTSVNGSSSGSTSSSGSSSGSSSTSSSGGSSGSTSSSGSSSGSSSTSSSGSSGGSDGGMAGTCGQATLFAGNPNFADPAQRPADGANILTGTPYLYQQLHFTSAGQILTNDQLSVWRIDPSTSELHAVAGGPLTGNAELLAGAAPGVPCSTARFADLLGSAVDSHGNVFVADYANAILEVTNPLDASTCAVSYFAGTAQELDGPMLDQSDGNSGTADGTGSAAQFMGPQWLTIDGSDNLYLLDHGTA
ncbi:MAG: hypothetical protein ABSE49_26190, partial [Polyangiaceae bacterium]